MTEPKAIEAATTETHPSDIPTVARYLLTVAKLQSEEESLPLIEKALRELANSEIELCRSAIDAHSREWGEVARCTNRTCRDVSTKLSERIKR